MFSRRLSKQRLFTYAAESKISLLQLIESGSEDAVSDPGSGSHRLALIADSPTELNRLRAQAIERLSKSEKASFTIGTSIFYRYTADPPPKTAFLFPGFGAEHPSLFDDLHRHFPQIEAWFASLSPELQERFQANPSLFPYRRTKNQGAAQPLHKLQRKYLHHIDSIVLSNLACYYLLTEVLGISPDVVTGHSIGEATCLYAGGYVSEVEPIFELFQTLASQLQVEDGSNDDWAMAILTASARNTLEDLDASTFPSLTLTMDNCPQQSIYCLKNEELPELIRGLSSHGETAAILSGMDFPAHSERLPITRQALSEAYAELDLLGPRTPVYSCSTGQRLGSESTELMKELIEQWLTPVCFVKTLKQLHRDGITHFLEVGPGGRLTGFVRDTLRGKGCFAQATSLENKPGIEQLLTFVATLFVRNYPVDVANFCQALRSAPFLDSQNPKQTEIKDKASAPNLGRIPQRQLSEQFTGTILATIRNILELDESGSLNPELGFFQLGLNSIDAVRMVDELNQQLDVSIAAPLLFSYQTPQALGRYIAQLKAPGVQAASIQENVSGEADPSSENEAIAIIGMACRFPGEASTTEELWEQLSEGTDAIRSVPKNRWSIPPEEAYLSQGGFIEDIAGFDSGFFELSPKEAISLDPQQRWLLEVTWEALEHAGIAPRTLHGSQTGVFVGISHADYAHRLDMDQRLHEKGYIGTGNAHFTAAGRLSYFLGIQGPCVAVDTACSSSLVAVHQACQSIRDGSCRTAIVGGVQLLTSPESSIYLSQAHALSPQARCRSFDAAANGYVRGEGCGIVILKPLQQALEDGDQVLATIEGSAVNHNGHTSGLTVPSGLAQRDVIRQALRNSQVDAEQIIGIEAHGTGTSLGDPIEAQALGEIFARSHSSSSPLLVSSIKSYIGHLEAAAGIAGLIKATLQLQKRQFLPGLHFEQPNPHIDWETLPIEVCQESVCWDTFAPNQSIGVSSFGISGTNAHVILSEHRGGIPNASADHVSELRRRSHLLTLSAKTPSALNQMRERYRAFLSHSGKPLEDICQTSNLGRSHFAYREAYAIRSRKEAAERIGQQMEAPAKRVEPYRPQLAFLFTGQGSQYPKMGYGLYQTEPIFRATIDACEAIAQSQGYSILETIRRSGENESAESTSIHRTEFAQPCLFALQYALGKLWAHWGIEPDTLLGHSIGEYAACCLAGVFSLEDALRMVRHRGQLMQSLPENGTMLSVETDEATILELLSDSQLQLSVAAVNTANSVVLSGLTRTVEQVSELLKARSVACTRLHVSHAFHSELMDPMLEPFRTIAQETSYHSPTLPVISSMTGQLESQAFATPDYWVEQIRATVRFEASLQQVVANGCGLFLELGPKPTLLNLAQGIPECSKISMVSSLHPRTNDDHHIIEALGQLYEAGYLPNWQNYHRHHPGKRTTLPSYPFAKERYWIEPDRAKSRSNGKAINNRTLLGEALTLPGTANSRRFESHCSRSQPKFWKQQQIQGKTYLPNAAILAILRKAAEVCQTSATYEIRDLTLLNAVELTEESCTLHTEITQPNTETAEATLFARPTPEAGWQTIASAHLPASPATWNTQEQWPKPTPASGQTTTEGNTYYESSQRIGFQTAPALQSMQQLISSPEAIQTRISIPAPASDSHPDRPWITLLDAASQALGAFILQKAPGKLFVPEEAASILFGDAEPQGDYHVQVRESPNTFAETKLSVDILICETSSMQPVLYFEQMCCTETQWSATKDRKNEESTESVLEWLNASADDEERSRRLERYLRKVLVAILGLSSTSAVDPGANFNSQGMDSIMSMALRIQLQQDLFIELKQTPHLQDLELSGLIQLVAEALDSTEKESEVLQLSAAGAATQWVEGEI